MGKYYKKRGWVKITRKEDGSKLQEKRMGKNYKKIGWLKITRKEDG